MRPSASTTVPEPMRSLPRILVDVPGPGEPVTLVGCAPRAVLRVLGDGTVDGSVASDPLAAIEAFVGEEDDLPFPFGAVVGYLAYELARFTDPARGRAAAAGD